MAEFDYWVITFDPNGGTINGSTSQYQVHVTKDKTVGTLPTAVRQGYKFLQWTDINDDVCTSNTKPIKDTVYYARWEKVTNCYIKQNGEYKAGMMYVRRNGEYVQADIPYIRDNGTYKSSN